MIRTFVGFLLLLLISFSNLGTPTNVAASLGADWNSAPLSATYYMSPNGSDTNSGGSEAQAWATFKHAWTILHPGDTLILMDGVYYQPLRPDTRGGEPGNPITIRAQNDGQAIIDGQGQRETVVFQAYQGAVHFVVEGIVARNSNSSVYVIFAPNNTFRRVSGYNANVDNNEHIFSIWADNVTLEDCVASGTGRKMIMSYKGNNNVIRRCYAHWERWDGRNFCDPWPWGDGIQIYIGDDNIVENSIVNGPVPGFGLSIQANGDPAETNVRRNKILGSAALNAGIDDDGSAKEWGNSRPGPTECTEIRDFGWPAQRAGFAIWGPGETKENLFQDVLAWGNAGLGFAIEGTQIYENPIVNRATIINNGRDIWAGHYEGPPGNNIRRLDLLDITNSEIGGTSHSGQGADLTKRYVTGTLTDEDLWPWPMEQRIRDELGLSVTNLMADILPDQIDEVGGPVPTRPPATPTPTPPATATPAPVQASTLPGKVQMEAYQTFFDQSPGNLFASEAPGYSDDVDVRPTGDEEGGYKIGAIDPDEWLTFEIDVTEGGTYAVSARIASDDQDVTKSLTLYIDKFSPAEIGPINIAPTYSGGWDTFIDVSGGDLELAAGAHTLRVEMNSGWFDINYLTFTLIDGNGEFATPRPSTQPTATGSATVAPTAGATATPTVRPTGGSAVIPEPSPTPTPASNSSVHWLYLPMMNAD